MNIWLLRKGFVLVMIIFFVCANITPIIAYNDKDIEKTNYIQRNLSIGLKKDDYNNLIKYAIECGVLSNIVWSEQDKLLSSDLAIGDSFGYSVSIDGNTALIGTPGDDENGNESGSAYIFTRTDKNWIKQTKLLPLDGEEGDSFGHSVSLNGTTALIGAPWDDDNKKESGSVYIFRGSDIYWSQETKLLASDGAEGDSFGFSVSVDGNTALIGAPMDEENGKRTGSAYIFTCTDNNWIQQKKLLASDETEYVWFGFSVSINNNTAIIGAPVDSDTVKRTGSAYIFTRTDKNWTQQSKVIHSDGEENDLFGFTVSINKNTALIGSPGDDEIGIDSGSAYIFTRSYNKWTQKEKLIASDGQEGAFFGYSVSLDVNTAILGAPRDEENGIRTGSAYIFTFLLNKWTQQEKLLASDGEEEDEFGYSVSIDGNTTLIGMPEDDDYGNNSGSAYVFVKNQIEEPELKVTIKRGLRRSIRIIIENIGSVNANNITWKINVTRRGIFKRTILDVTGNISALEVGLNKKIFDRPFGIGLIKVTVNVTAPYMEPIVKTVKGFIFLRFVRLRRFF